MSKSMYRYVKIVDRINVVTKWIMIALLLLCVGECFVEVVCRYVLKIPIGWGNEFCRYTMIWLAYLAGGHACRQGRMIKLEVIFVLFKNMPAAGKRFFEFLSAIISMVFYAAAIYCTWIVIMKISGIQYSAAMILPMSFMYSSIVVGMFLMILNTIASLIDPMVNDDVSDAMDLVEEIEADELTKTLKL